MPTSVLITAFIAAQSKGIDYHQALDTIVSRASPLRTTLAYMAFVKKLALLMGRKGSLSAFLSHELETLKKCYNRIPTLNESLLTEAFQKASPKTLPYIIHELQTAHSNSKEVS